MSFGVRPVGGEICRYCVNLFAELLFNSLDVISEFQLNCINLFGELFIYLVNSFGELLINLVNPFAEFQINRIDLLIQSLNFEVNKIKTLIGSAESFTHFATDGFVAFEDYIKFAVHVLKENFQMFFFHDYLRSRAPSELGNYGT
jgi:hypothetical protein